MKKNLLSLGIILSCFSQVYSQNQYTISGTVSDSLSQETTIGSLVYIKGTTNGVASNVYGFYSLTVPEGKYELVISYLGYVSQTHQIDLKSNITLNSKLKSSENTLKEVVVSAESNREKEQVRSAQMSSI